MRKIIILLILFCLMTTGCGNTTSKEVNDMNLVDEVKEIIDNYSDYSNIYIVDVREEDEYNSGHIREAINIPLSSIETIKLDKDAKIILYCQSGRRSANALAELKKLGYTNVYDMGGINTWPYDLVL